MELSEDYTCIISRGPNPKTTHIFDDCIVGSCCGVFTFNSSEKEASYPSESFLSSCDNCGKNLGQGRDIYMYRSVRFILSILYSSYIHPESAKGLNY
ncbi:FCS-Like Zinc finger 8 [Linum perenne]